MLKKIAIILADTALFSWSLLSDKGPIFMGFLVGIVWFVPLGIGWLLCGDERRENLQRFFQRKIMPALRVFLIFIPIILLKVFEVDIATRFVNPLYDSSPGGFDKTFVWLYSIFFANIVVFYCFGIILEIQNLFTDSKIHKH